IIAQRISSVKDADQIIVLQHGKIAERGTHEELLRNHGYYWETYALQNDLPGAGQAAEEAAAAQVPAQGGAC
ncbi:MAG TPA: ABC transporter ATP-binding protein, partial [Firmicutes bacterium]|nr:ABC transporter ATP-binding protein [Bacillota bacterium]